MSAEVFLFLPVPDATTDYREAYPFGPSVGQFHTDLGIEIDPAALPDSPALAVMSGMVRYVPFLNGILILTVQPDLAHSLANTFDSTMVFVYRNIDFDSMIKLFESRIEAIKDTIFENQDREIGFVNGVYQVWVDAGDELGLPGAGDNGWGLLGFEIVYMPPFALGQAGLVRLLELIKKATTRRLDPMSFYSTVVKSAPDLDLTPAHANHPLLTVPTRRTLLELRDEYDDPSSLDIDVWDSTIGASTTVKFDPLQHGTRVLATAPVTGNPEDVVYSLSKNNYLFTDLPSGQKALEQLNNIIGAPSHWAVQAIYMPPSNSVALEPDSWFVRNTLVDVATTTPLPRYTSGNLITPIRDGLEVFARSKEAISMAQGSGDFILMANWWFDDGLKLNGDDNRFYLIPSDSASSLAALIAMATNNGVQVRALLFDQFFDPETLIKPNEAQAKRINGFPSGNGIAILDDIHPFLGSHHQKFMVVKGKDHLGLVKVKAFCGGVDFNSNRRDSHEHRAFGGYHDVHAEVEGPAVLDIFQSFKERWEIHSSPLSPALDPRIVTAPPEGNAFVQVARTYPGIEKYKFAPFGSYTPLEALLRAIKRAKKFIYIEDQYLTPYSGSDPDEADDDNLEVLKSLKLALKTIDYLLIVIPNHTEMAWLKKAVAFYATLTSSVPDAFKPDLDLLLTLAPLFPGQARFRRKMFIRGLKSDPELAKKVHVFYLGRDRKQVHSKNQSIALGEATEGDSPLSSGSPAFPDEIYCHSKVWIVDDIIAKIGSANCNWRSYTHDSEMDLVMVDGALESGGRALARKFRMELWGEHLGMDESRVGMLQDHLHALTHWIGRPQLPGSHIRAYDEEFDAPEDRLFNVGWDLILDPSGRED
jgi:phosphatidylserine/phosphatidylglycerophosphate/cardiolipin synthase-like enzyme